MGAGGNVASLKVKFNGLILHIRSQTLIDCAVDTCITSNSADMFNRVNEAFFNFQQGYVQSSIINHIIIVMT